MMDNQFSAAATSTSAARSELEVLEMQATLEGKVRTIIYS
jgi:hypothetical protein